MKTRFTLIALVALILTAASSQITFAAASNGDQASSVYLQIKEAAEARQDELLYLLEEDLPTDVMTSLQTAIQLMQQAETVSAEDPHAALQYYLDAMKYFRETWTNYLKNDEQASTNTLEKVTDPETPPEIIIDDEFENEIKQNKVRLLDKFQERITEKYISLYSEIEEIVDDLTEEDSAKILKTFQNAQDKLGKIRDKFEKGEVDDALDSLDSSLLTFEDDLEYLSDKDALKTIKKIEHMDKQTYKVEAEKEKKIKNGEDTEEEDSTIQEIKEDIKEAKEEFKSNKGKSEENSSDKKPSQDDTETEESSNNDNPTEKDKKTNQTEETEETSDNQPNGNDNSPSEENENNSNNGNGNNSSHGNSSNSQGNQKGNKKDN